MKQKLIKGLFLGIVLLGASSVASAQIYVKIRPVVPVVVRTERPSPQHVWVDEDWQEGDGGYRYSGGHWAKPPQDNEEWHQGHWSHRDRGDRWIQGHWGRKHY
jgi:hypothetical protein